MRGFMTHKGVDMKFGFNGVDDWLDSVILSFPAPWVLGDNTHYGSEIFDAQGNKVLSVWMAWGNPSERQRGTMSEAEWVEYCSDSHWESETQWHVANAIVTTRNYLHMHDVRGFIGDNNRQLGILRNLVTAYASWGGDVEEVVKCGGPNRRVISDEAEKLNPHLTCGRISQERIDAMKARERMEILQKIKDRTPDVGLNPEAVESQNRSRALMSAMWRMIDEQPPQSVMLDNGLKVDSMTIMDKPYLERLAQIADEEYDTIKSNQMPKVVK